MSKKIDWLEVFSRLIIGFMIAGVIAMFAIGFTAIVLENTTARTVMLHDDSGTSYACTVSKADTNPHDCKPIKDMK